MTNKVKLALQWNVRFYLGDGKTDKEIVDRLKKYGYKEATIKKYIKAFTK
jgi:hypothetical protein